MSTTMIVLKKGEDFPVGILPILKYKDLNLCSIAFANGDGVQSLVIPASKMEWSTAIKKIHERYPDTVKAFHFSADTGNTKDQQPFPILHEGDEIALAVMLEGEFPTFVKDDKLSNEYHAFNEYLDGKIKAEFGNCNEDLDKLLEKLDSPTFRMELSGFLEPRAAMYIIAKTGKVIAMMKNLVTARTFSWGSITNNHGFGDEKKEVVPKIPAKVEEKPKAKLDLSNLMEEPKKESELIPMNPQKTDTKIPDKTVEETFSCPDEYKGAARKHWESRNLLDKYHRMPGWENTGAKRLKYTRAMLKPDSPLLGKAKDFKEAKKILEEKEDKKAGGLITGVTHDMSPKSKESIVNLIHEKHLIVSSEQFEELEKEYDRFTDQLNISEDLPLFWGLAGYLHLTSKTAHGAALLLNQFARRILELDKTIAPKMLEKITEPEKPAKKSKLNLDDLKMG